MAPVSDAGFHEGRFKRNYCYTPRDVVDVKVESAPQGKTLRAIVEPRDKSVAVEYRAAARADNTVTMAIRGDGIYRLRYGPLGAVPPGPTKPR